MYVCIDETQRRPTYKAIYINYIAAITAVAADITGSKYVTEQYHISKIMSFTDKNIVTFRTANVL